jgi:hypothetical protein
MSDFKITREGLDSVIAAATASFARIGVEVDSWELVGTWAEGLPLRKSERIVRYPREQYQSPSSDTPELVGASKPPR